MPQQGNIAQYTSPIDKLEPSEVGAEALARAGRGIGAQYRQIGQDYQQSIDRVGDPLAQAVDQHETMTEISQGSAALAAMHANFTTQWNEMASKYDPNDKSIQGTFLDNTVEPQLQAFQDGFSTEKGQQWALSQADALRSHLYDKTSADMSTRAGSAVVENMKTTLTMLSDTARKDPSSMDASIGQINSLVQAAKENNTGNLSPEQIAKMDDLSRDMKNEVVKAGLQGLADVNPQAAVAAINSGKFSPYISGTEGDQLIKYSEGITRMKLEDQTRAYENQQRQQKIQEDAAANKILDSIYNPTTGQLNIPDNINQQIFQNQSLSAKAKIDLMGAVKHISQDSDVTDPSVRSSNFAALGDDSLTQSDLISQAAQGKLSKEDLSFFSERLKQTPDAEAEKGALANAMKQVQDTILTPAAPGIPPSPAQRQAQVAFTNWFMPAYTSALQDPSFKGMSQSQKAQILLSSTDPKGLLTPDKLAPFMVSPQQMLQDGLKGVGPLPSQGGATTPSGPPSVAKPAASDISYLIANPAKAAAFDKQFGAGASAKILGAQ
jgi:hypothetical protein